MTKAIHDMTSDTGVETLGGKGAALARLARSGFNVPRFLVIESNAFGDKGLSEESLQALFEQLPKVGQGPFAVRSSAMEEDGASHSHAGQFLSILNVHATNLAHACWQVWQSGRSETVADYRASRGLDGESDGVAVVVQQMVKARAAGVAFTADPVNGRRDRILISAIEGYGDRLVGGEEDGETYTLDKADGQVIESPDQSLLSPADLEALHQLSTSVEQASNGPQDIEWAFEEGQLFLLQTRPITTALRSQPIDDDKLQIFDNSNIIESYPGLVSPLTYSFAQYAYARVYRSFVRLMGVAEPTIQAHASVFDNMLARIDGRVYYNLVNWYKALALLPGFSRNRDHMETMMGVNEPLPEELARSISVNKPKGLQRLFEWLRIAKVALRLAFEALRLDRTVTRFYQRLNIALTTPVSAFETMSLTTLAAEYRRIEADLLDRWDAPIINDFLCMMAFGGSRKLMERWAGEEGLSLHNDIMIGQGDIVSAEPAQRIRAMGKLLQGKDALRAELERGDGQNIGDHPDLENAIVGYLEKFSDRCTEELKLESVTLDRDPSPLYMAIAAASGSDFASSRGHGDIDDQDQFRTLFPEKPVRRFLARRFVGWAKRRVRDRENLRFERTRIFGRGRRVFRAIGQQFHAHHLLDDPDDIYFLTVDEVLGAIEGFAVSHNLAELSALRKADMASAEQRPDPAERLTVRGAALSGLRTAIASEPAKLDDQTTRMGTGCSAGKVTAKARVIRDPRREALERGDILVARHTDPGWIAVFSNASAIVVERGSLLSHSAIVARELGIPCVVGLKGAMGWIIDGEMIEIDGASGQVRKVVDG